MQNSVGVLSTHNLYNQSGLPVLKLEQKERVWLAVKYYCHHKTIVYC